MSTAKLFAFMVAAVAWMPGAALAEQSLWEPAPGEEGFTYHSDRFHSDRSRAEVKGEVTQAVREGSLPRYDHDAPPDPAMDTGPSRTRRDVIDEYRNLTPQERERRRDIYQGG
jgi:hypothetical protein